MLEETLRDDFEKYIRKHPSAANQLFVAKAKHWMVPIS
jgi:hypothetical protein